jgi:hypothetical protein
MQDFNVQKLKINQKKVDAFAKPFAKRQKKLFWE